MAMRRSIRSLRPTMKVRPWARTAYCVRPSARIAATLSLRKKRSPAPLRRISGCNALPSGGLAAGAGERQAAESARVDAAGNLVAVHLAGEGERQRHRLGDVDLPGDLVAVHRAVVDIGGALAARLLAAQRAAVGGEDELGHALVHGRVDGDVAGALRRHALSPALFSRSRSEPIADAASAQSAARRRRHIAQCLSTPFACRRIALRLPAL